MKLLLALLITLPAHASNNYDTTRIDIDNHSRTSSRSESSAVSKSSSSSISQGGESFARGGDSTATGGSAVGEGGNAQGGNSIGGDVSFNEKRSAPSVYAPSIQSTTPYLKCGPFGGSIADGGVAFGWCWIQRDAWGVRTFRELSGLGLFEDAANARCSTKLLVRPFGTAEKCKAKVLSALITKSALISSKLVDAEYETVSGPLLAEVDVEALQSRLEALEAELVESRQSTARAVSRARSDSQEAQQASADVYLVQMAQMIEDAEGERARVAADEAESKARFQAIDDDFQAKLKQIKEEADE